MLNIVQELRHCHGVKWSANRLTKHTENPWKYLTQSSNYKRNLHIYNRNQTLHKWYSITFLSVWYKIAYTQVNKCICLFPNLQGNMRLIMKANYWPHPQSTSHSQGSFDAKSRRVACGDHQYCIVEICYQWSRWANSWQLRTGILL